MNDVIKTAIAEAIGPYPLNDPAGQHAWESAHVIMGVTSLVQQLDEAKQSERMPVAAKQWIGALQQQLVLATPFIVQGALISSAFQVAAHNHAASIKQGG